MFYSAGNLKGFDVWSMGIIISETEIKNLYGLGNESAELFRYGSKIGDIDGIYQFLHLRVQIRKQKLTGYEIRFKDQMIKIDSSGELKEYPADFFNTCSNLLMELI